MSLTHSQKILAPQITIAMLVNGLDGHNNPVYAYIGATADKIKKMNDAIGEGHPIELEDYVTILASGEGHEPSEDVQKQMEEQYGMNHHLIEDLEEHIEKLKNDSNT